MVYKVSKIKIFEKLRESITDKQTEGKESAMNFDIKEPLEDVKNPDEAVKLIKKIDKMVKINKNNILIIAYKQGKMFKKF